MSNLLKINNSLVRAKIAPIVDKGTLIYMNLDGTTRQYKVLKCKGNVAMVMGMFDDLTSKYNSTSTTTTFGSTTAQKYEGSTLDTYLNTTWYNTLSTEAKNAIVPENVVQYCYKYYDEPNTPNTPTYTYQYQYNWSDSNYKNADNVGSVTVGERNVFALDLKDIFDYMGKVCITSDELMTMFWNSTTKVSKYLWLRSSSAGGSSRAWNVYGNYGRLDGSAVTRSGVVRPALNIDLSKIEWPTTEPVIDTTETWIFNKDFNITDLSKLNSLNTDSNGDFTVNFVSNGDHYDKIHIETS